MIFDCIHSYDLHVFISERLLLHTLLPILLKATNKCIQTSSILRASNLQNMWRRVREREREREREPFARENNKFYNNKGGI